MGLPNRGGIGSPAGACDLVDTDPAPAETVDTGPAATGRGTETSACVETGLPGNGGAISRSDMQDEYRSQLSPDLDVKLQPRRELDVTGLLAVLSSSPVFCSRCRWPWPSPCATPPPSWARWISRTGNAPPPPRDRESVHRNGLIRVVKDTMLRRVRDQRKRPGRRRRRWLSLHPDLKAAFACTRS